MGLMEISQVLGNLDESLARSRFLLVLAALYVLSACSENTGIETLGRPTLMAPGESPLDVICDIQQEFHQLQKPVLSEVQYVEKSSRSMTVEFHRTKELLPAYYHFQLSEAASAWISTHTSAELSVALMPIVLDPTIGGEAAIVLTSLSTGRRFRTNQYGYHHASIAADVSEFMHKSEYQSPDAPGKWNADLARQFRVPNEVTIVFEGRPFLGDEDSEFNRLAQSTNTLNHRLEQIQDKLHYYENGLMAQLVYGPDAFTSVETLDQWIAVNGLPKPPRREKHEELVANWSKEFIVLAAYPKGIPNGIGIYLLGLERYWPLLYNYQHTVRETYRYQALPKFDEYRTQYERELVERVYEVASSACANRMAVIQSG